MYRLGVIGTGTLSHDLNRWWHKVRGKEDPYLKIGEANVSGDKSDSGYVWALKDINLEVMPGEVLGIIGKNGAGKSTLLKILSRVTGPTTGSISYRGRMGSLLEVGTGFHPELTGRENIFLNGAILGMTKTEISRKFDEIVDFAGVERYIDTPVKRYSSGMKVRLGFAVAAHLEPEILVVDEVLAVGDAEFQKKAIGKMQDVSTKDGRTILFVSHNMAAVKSLCTRGVLLSNGQVEFSGKIEETIHKYIDGVEDINNIYYRSFEKGNEYQINELKLHSIGVRSVDKAFGKPIVQDEEMVFEITFDKNVPDDIVTNLRFKDKNGEYLFVSNSFNKVSNTNKQGLITHKLFVQKNFLNSESFSVDLMFIKAKKSILLINDVLFFTVQPKKNTVGSWMGKTKGPLTPDFKWYVETGN
ncbi:MAG: ABC transporter ATP-binding protein [Bacteroidetes bacterium]|nr:MAG: ABC transporter ATP-binding protein [Bacteroidota bacterium]